VGSAAENAEVDFFWRDRVNTWAHHFVEIFLFIWNWETLLCAADRQTSDRTAVVGVLDSCWTAAKEGGSSEE
jgi:hypothetical protein